MTDPVPFTLRIYDVLGREMATLMGWEQEPRFYDVLFGGSTLSPDVYLYRMLVGVAETAGLMMRMK